MVRVLLIRHGQTEWNRVERYRGQIDVPLNETGRQQAQALARRLASWSIQAVYAGPLERAVKTAEPIAEVLGLPCQPVAGFLDINYGEWVGLTPAEAALRDPESHDQWLNAPHLVRIPGGESLADIRDRAVAAVDELLDRHAEETIVIVGHQVVNKVVICAVLGLSNASFWRLRQENGCLNILAYHDGLFDLVTLNDTCHLASA
jgi:probable phosphoglycerate mutase